jgi:hypothetical protein
MNLCPNQAMFPALLPTISLLLSLAALGRSMTHQEREL